MLINGFERISSSKQQFLYSCNDWNSLLNELDTSPWYSIEITDSETDTDSVNIAFNCMFTYGTFAETGLETLAFENWVDPAIVNSTN